MNRPPPRSLVLAAVVAGSVAVLGVPLGAQATLSGASAFTCQGLAATIVGTDADDELTGTPGPDVIMALAGDDVVRAGAGDDVVCAGPGTDDLVGEEGDDRLFGERNGLQPSEDRPDTNVGDTLAGGPGDDLLVPGADRRTDVGGGFVPDTISYRGSVAGVQVDLERGLAAGEGSDTLLLVGRVDLLGSDHDDVLLGSWRSDWIRSFAGDDVVDGRGGRDGLLDQLDVGAADAPRDDDLFIGGPGNDYLDPGRGTDTVRAGAGDDVVEDLWGPSDVLGGPGDDEVAVVLVLDHAVSTQVSGGGGYDELALEVSRGGALARASVGLVDLRTGHSNARPDDPADTRRARGSTDGFEAVGVPEGLWRVRGSARNETVYGPLLESSRLVAHMGAGRDRVYGGPGPDLIVGGSGRDASRPGGGEDTCRSVEWSPPQDRCEIDR